MIVLIPAYQPDENLIELILQLTHKCTCRIIVVDDGSGKKYRRIFQSAENLGCTVITYYPNMGKGSALKAGFQYVLRNPEFSEDVVCADCDGQHSVNDILRVAGEMQSSDSSIILGSRKFKGKVPFKSLLGNRFTCLSFFLSTGIRISDTQTGLRGYPAKMLPWLITLKGNHYEYELNVLLEASKAGYSLREIPIETIYMGNNESSHFRPVVDSVRIYWPLIKFSMSSLTAAGLDFLALLILDNITGNLLFSVVTARVFSSLFNFAANRTLVFNNPQSSGTGKAAVRYFALVLFILACNYSLMYLFIEVLKINLVLAKLLTEALLFTLSYQAQRVFVFSSKKRSPMT